MIQEDNPKTMNPITENSKPFSFSSFGGTDWSNIDPLNPGGYVKDEVAYPKPEFGGNKSYPKEKKHCCYMCMNMVPSKDVVVHKHLKNKVSYCFADLLGLLYPCLQG